MRSSVRSWGAAAAALALVAALAGACGDSDATVEITAPAAGDSVVLPFEVTVEASVPLGPPDDDRHHVHVWFGADESAYLVVESSTVEITTAPVGEQDLHVSLRHADHSDAGATDSIPLVIRDNG